MKKQCPVCGSTRITDKHCLRCNSSLTPFNARNICKALAIVLAFIIVASLIQNDILTLCK